MLLLAVAAVLSPNAEVLLLDRRTGVGLVSAVPGCTFGGCRSCVSFPSVAVTDVKTKVCDSSTGVRTDSLGEPFPQGAL